jgi:hypothetical protein
MADTFSREAVGIFHDEKSLRSAADALMISGFDRSYLSLLASDKAVDQKLGHHYERVAELEDDPDVPTQAYVGSDSRVEGQAAVIGGLVYVGAIASIGAVVASGGTATIALIGAMVAGGAGGAGDSPAACEYHAKPGNELQRGGLLWWGRRCRARAAIEILGSRWEDACPHCRKVKRCEFTIWLGSTECSCLLVTCRRNSCIC